MTAKVWTIYKFASKLTWIGVIETETEEEAIEIASKEFKVASNRLIAKLTRSSRDLSARVPIRFVWRSARRYALTLKIR